MKVMMWGFLALIVMILVGAAAPHRTKSEAEAIERLDARLPSTEKCRPILAAGFPQGGSESAKSEFTNCIFRYAHSKSKGESPSMQAVFDRKEDCYIVLSPGYIAAQKLDTTSQKLNYMAEHLACVHEAAQREALLFLRKP